MNVKSTYLICLMLLLSFVIKAQETELKGDIIYSTFCGESLSDVQKAFDNNVNTYFTSCSRIGNWIGFDLKEKHVITKLAYSPRIDGNYQERFQLGVFEGANNPDFGDAIPLFIISGATDKQLTEQLIDCSKGFRYVRFVFPTPLENGRNNYMGELKFFGHKSNGDNSRLPQLTNLPTVSIHTVDAQDITSKEYYIKGIITTIWDNGRRMHTDSVEIKGRGNNSWSHPKKPYRIKLAKKAKLLDLPVNARNWTLINNYGDKTLMRNMLAFDFSRRLEMPYTSPAEGVDVVINGDYKGCYQLCDHIDVRKTRVDITEMTPDDLTGGYMVEIDAYAGGELKHFTSQQYEIPVSIKYPKDDEITYTQEKYIEEHFNKWSKAVNTLSNNGSLTNVEKYMDFETFLRHFLVGEYTGNTDTYWSVKMTKEKDDDKFRFGPVWDFDLGFENDWRTYPINDKSDWICLTGHSSAAGNTKELIRKLINHTNVNNRLKEIYSYYRDRNIISKEVLLNVVDEKAAYLQQSQDLNFKRWRIMDTKVHENPVIHGSYDAEVANVKNYISKRIDWMDKKLSYKPNPLSEPITIRFHKPASWTQLKMKIKIDNGEWTDCVPKKEAGDWYAYTSDWGENNLSVSYSDGIRFQSAVVGGINEDICLATTGKLNASLEYVIETTDCESGQSLDVEPITVRFNKPQSWETVYLQQTGEALPGMAMKEEANAWYSYTFDVLERKLSLSFNDGKELSTANIEIDRDACLGTIGELDKDLKYKIALIDCETGESLDVKTITVRFHKPNNWTSIKMKAITDIDGNWTEYPLTEDIDNWFFSEFGAVHGKIDVYFSNESEVRTNYILDVDNDICLGTSGQWLNNEYTKCEAVNIDCENGKSIPPVVPDPEVIADLIADKKINLQTINSSIIVNSSADYPLFLRITDLTGRVVSELPIAGGANIIQVNKGIYLLIFSDEQQRYTYKYIVL